MIYYVGRGGTLLPLTRASELLQQIFHLVSDERRSQSNQLTPCPALTPLPALPPEMIRKLLRPPTRTNMGIQEWNSRKNRFQFLFRVWMRVAPKIFLLTEEEVVKERNICLEAIDLYEYVDRHVRGNPSLVPLWGNLECNRLIVSRLFQFRGLIVFDRENKKNKAFYQFGFVGETPQFLSPNKISFYLRLLNHHVEEFWDLVHYNYALAVEERPLTDEEVEVINDAVIFLDLRQRLCTRLGFSAEVSKYDVTTFPRDESRICVMM